MQPTDSLDSRTIVLHDVVILYEHKCVTHSNAMYGGVASLYWRICRELLVAVKTSDTALHCA